jgi:glycolate dehydrogenase FAD-binding subunit
VDRPTTIDEAARLIRDGAQRGQRLRPRGGGSKLGWTAANDFVEIDTRGLNKIVEHNAGDFTAILEAGVPLAEAQTVFARAGQMLALDPYAGSNNEATIGGVIASNDSGPMRHRYGSARDVVIGMTVVLSDGTIASSGGKVIKNVAGYDLGKLFTGSFGTLGLIARVAVRLHPLPQATATVVARSNEPDRMGAAVVALARLPLEADCFDVVWQRYKGELLVRFAGAAAEQRAHAAAARIHGLADVNVIVDDAGLWEHQRARQRNAEGVIVKVSGRATDLPQVIRATDAARGRVVSRAAQGLSWIAFPADVNVAAVRKALAPRACTVLDGAARVPDAWPVLEPGALALMQRVKSRFDPARIFQPCIFAGGI